MKQQKIIAIFALCLVVILPKIVKAELPTTRFFHSGDGKLTLNSTHSKATFSGQYRNAQGEYNQEAIEKIYAVFSNGQQKGKISLRLVEFLDYLQEHFQGGKITIISGYRSPSYNTNLRKNGRLAAKASLHQYGMAADIVMQGVSSREIWDYVKQLGFGGAGYYYGKTVHVDVGPARSWDSKTSGVGLGLADDNKLIMIVTDKDIYRPGETINMHFARMTAWPIGVKSEFILERVDQKKKKTKRIKPQFAGELKADQCQMFKGFSGMFDISWPIPAKLKPGRYQIKVKFCDKEWTKMPEEIVTSEFLVQD